MEKSCQETIGILQQRKIEAQIIKPIYELMKAEFGIEKAQEIIARAVNQSAFDAGQEFARQEKEKTSVKSFVALQHLWTQDDALEIEVPVNTDTRYDYTVRRCRYAEMYRELGLAEIGTLLSCNRDKKFIEGYAPHIRFERPHTIMNGDGFCDFSYQQIEEKKDEK